jgi:hypothetical protein
MTISGTLQLNGWGVAGAIAQVASLAAHLLFQ